MTQADIYRQDLRVIISDAPVTFTFNGEQHVGTISGLRDRRPLEVGGFEDQPEITLVAILTSDSGEPVFVSPPRAGDSITIGSVTYQVESREIDPFNVGLQLDLRSQNR